MVDANIYDYQAHINLIGKCSEMQQWEKLRSAREIMSSTFPLTEQLWLWWIGDEIKLEELSTSEVCLLFERAVEDYLNPQVWFEYCCYVEKVCIKEKNEYFIKKALNTFERALTAVCLDPNANPKLFASYRSFLKNKELTELLKNLENVPTVSSLFKRQLSIPFLESEAVFKEFVEAVGSDDETEKAYDRAKKVLSKVKPCQIALEESLKSGESSLEKFRDYLEVEMTIGDPSRIRCIFERAIQHNALESELWSKYIEFTSMKIKDYQLAEKICKRAVRNVLWVPIIWQHYVNVCEHLNKSEAEVDKIVSEAKVSLYGQDSSQFFLAYLAYLRRSFSKCQTGYEKEHLKKFRDAYHKALDNLSNLPEAVYQVKRFAANVEAKYFTNLDVFRKIFDKILVEDSLNSTKWIEYLSLEEKLGTVFHLQKLYHRAFMYPRMSEPEKLVENYLLYERLNGTLQSLEVAIYKTELFLSKVERAKETDRIKEEKYQEKQMTANNCEKLLKRPHESNSQANKSLTPYSSDKSSAKKPKVEGTNPFKKNKLENEEKVNSGEENNQLTDVSKNVEVPQSHAKNIELQAEVPSFISNEENADVSVFLANLDFNATEEDIRTFFMSCGSIEAVSIARKVEGKSRGFGNCIFKTKESVAEAMKLNREPLRGRPVFVSKYDMSKKAAKQNETANEQSAENKLVYTTGLERHKLFVSDLSTKTTKETLNELFSNHGLLKDVRIVTYKNGKPKGLAFVEFNKEDEAGKALVALDGATVDGQQIKIAIRLIYFCYYVFRRHKEYHHEKAEM